MVLLVAILLVIGTVALLLRPAQAESGLAEARARWEAGAPANYRLRITRQMGGGVCNQEIIARGDEMTAVENNCRQPSNWTVPRLFDWIAELQRVPIRCYPGPSRCACQGSTSTTVRYDESLGFPREIIYEWRKRPNFAHPAYWQSLFDRSFAGCNADPDGLIIVHVALTEEP